MNSGVCISVDNAFYRTPGTDNNSSTDIYTSKNILLKTEDFAKSIIIANVL